MIVRRTVQTEMRCIKVGRVVEVGFLEQVLVVWKRREELFGCCGGPVEAVDSF